MQFRTPTCNSYLHNHAIVRHSLQQSCIIARWNEFSLASHSLQPSCIATWERILTRTAKYLFQRLRRNVKSNPHWRCKALPAITMHHRMAPSNLQSHPAIERVLAFNVNRSMSCSVEPKRQRRLPERRSKPYPRFVQNPFAKADNDAHVQTARIHTGT